MALKWEHAEVFEENETLIEGPGGPVLWHSQHPR